MKPYDLALVCCCTFVSMVTEWATQSPAEVSWRFSTLIPQHVGWQARQDYVSPQREQTDQLEQRPLKLGLSTRTGFLLAICSLSKPPVLYCEQCRMNINLDFVVEVHVNIIVAVIHWSASLFYLLGNQINSMPSNALNQ